MCGRRRNVFGIGVVIAMMLFITLPANAIFVTFEEGLGHDYEEINTRYEGITFESAGSGLPWVYSDVTTGNYNASSWPSGEQWGSGEYWMNDYVCTWTTESGYDGKIVCNAQDATFAQINYSTYDYFYFEAYNADNELLDSDMGTGNLRHSHGNEDGPGTVYVEAPPGETIAYLLLHDTGNYWIVDNFLCDCGAGGPANLQIMKFYDLDADGTWDEGEAFLQGWEFHVEGPSGYDEWFTTDNNGLIEIQELVPGVYTITETVQSGWTCTTENPQDITVVEDLTGVAWFGNLPSSLWLDIKCNGEDGNVIVNEGNNVILTINIFVSDWEYALYPVEVWVLYRNTDTGDIFSYGPYDDPLWESGMRNFYYQGVLMDMLDTVLDEPILIGSYKAYLVVDRIPDGELNLPFLLGHDIVDFEVVP